MSTELKAIETVYNNYKFRSRLEARWAVFFDYLKIKYQYEFEGFDLGEAGWYLPDFYLTEYRIYIEIKPALSLITPSEWLKIEAMQKMIANGWDSIVKSGVTNETFPILLLLLTEAPDVPWQDGESSKSIRCLFYEFNINWESPEWTHLISEAVKAARQARF